jgi:protein O-mannosyl-transferase
MAKPKQVARALQPKTGAHAKVMAAPGPVPQSQKGLPEYWLIAILLAVAFLVNAPTINYSYTLDDPFFTKDNPLVRAGVSSIPEFFKHAAYYGVFKNHDASYRPLLLISFAIEKQLAGDFNPMVSHLVNLLLFCLQVFTLYQLLRAMFSRYSVYVPFFIVLLFELHPVHTEVIASVKSRDEIFALLFMSLCMLQSLRYIDTGKTARLLLSGLFFFLALMSKETPVCFVAIVPLTIYFFRQAQARQIVIATIPYVLVTGIYMVMRMAFIESDGQKVTILVNNNALMAAANYSEKLATALFIQLKYIILLVFPHPLSYDYSYNQIPIIGLANPKALFSLAVLLGLLVYAVRTFKQKSVFSYCILFYFAFVALTSNIIVNIGATMAERFIYTASLGFCIAGVFLVIKLFRSDPAKLTIANSSKVFAAFIAVALLYSVKTMARNGDWKDNVVLYESGLETAPNSWRVHNLLGVEYTKRISAGASPAAKAEMYDKAMANLNKSLEILPSPEVYLIKGYAYEFGGRDDSAIVCYRAITKVENNHQAINNLGAIYLRRNMYDSAISILGRYVATDSSQTDMLGNLAAAYGNSGNLAAAIKYYQMAIRINPDQPSNVFTSLTNIYHIMGDSAKTQYYRQLLARSLQKK